MARNRPCTGQGPYERRPRPARPHSESTPLLEVSLEPIQRRCRSSPRGALDGPRRAPSIGHGNVDLSDLWRRVPGHPDADWTPPQALLLLRVQTRVHQAAHEARHRGPALVRSVRDLVRYVEPAPPNLQRRVQPGSRAGYVRSTHRSGAQRDGRGRLSARSRRATQRRFQSGPPSPSRRPQVAAVRVCGASLAQAIHHRRIAGTPAMGTAMRHLLSARRFGQGRAVMRLRPDQVVRPTRTAGGVVWPKDPHPCACDYMGCTCRTMLVVPWQFMCGVCGSARSQGGHPPVRRVAPRSAGTRDR